MRRVIALIIFAFTYGIATAEPVAFAFQDQPPEAVPTTSVDVVAVMDAWAPMAAGIVADVADDPVARTPDPIVAIGVQDGVDASVAPAVLDPGELERFLASLAPPPVAKRAERAPEREALHDEAPEAVVPTPDPSPDEVMAMIVAAATEFGIDPELPLAVAACESGYRPRARNASSAGGVFQFLDSTWRSNMGRFGYTFAQKYEAEPNVRTAVAIIAEGGIGAWNASRHCWG